MLNRISKQNSKKKRSIEQIKANAEQEHGKKAKDYTYFDVDGAACIGTQPFNISERKKQFAEQIANKYDKYKDRIGVFDEFIVLCDAQFRVEINTESDIWDVIDCLSTIYTSVHNITIAFIWDYNGSIRVSQCRI